MREVPCRYGVTAAGSGSLSGWGQKLGVYEHLCRWLEHRKGDFSLKVFLGLLKAQDQWAFLFRISGI